MGIPEPSPGPLSLRIEKTSMFEELPEIDDIEIDDISIMSQSPEVENNIISEHEKEASPEDKPEDDSNDKPEISSEDKPEHSDINNVELLPEESSPRGKVEDENSFQHKDEINETGKTMSAMSLTSVATPSDEVDEANEVLYFTDVNPVVIGDKFLKMRKQGGVYFVPFKTPLIIQTPVFKLSEPLTGGSVSLKVTKGFSTFVKEIEKTILNAALVNKGKWFRTELTDEIITEGFKSFMNEYDLRVKVSEDLTSFDNEGNYIENNFKTPVGVRCILELSGICFGKLEFGSMFTLTQVQTTKIPKCVIDVSREKRTDGTSFSGDFV